MGQPTMPSCMVSILTQRQATHQQARRTDHGPQRNEAQVARHAAHRVQEPAGIADQASLRPMDGAGGRRRCGTPTPGARTSRRRDRSCRPRRRRADRSRRRARSTELAGATSSRGTTKQCESATRGRSRHPGRARLPIARPRSVPGQDGLAQATAVDQDARAGGHALAVDRRRGRTARVAAVVDQRDLGRSGGSFGPAIEQRRHRLARSVDERRRDRRQQARSHLGREHHVGALSAVADRSRAAHREQIDHAIRERREGKAPRRSLDQIERDRRGVRSPPAPAPRAAATRSGRGVRRRGRGGSRCGPRSRRPRARRGAPRRAAAARGRRRPGAAGASPRPRRAATRRPPAARSSPRSPPARAARAARPRPPRATARAAWGCRRRRRRTRPRRRPRAPTSRPPRRRRWSRPRAARGAGAAGPELEAARATALGVDLDARAALSEQPLEHLAARVDRQPETSTPCSSSPGVVLHTGSRCPPLAHQPAPASVDLAPGAGDARQQVAHRAAQSERADALVELAAAQSASVGKRSSNSPDSGSRNPRDASAA